MGRVSRARRERVDNKNGKVRCREPEWRSTQKPKLVLRLVLRLVIGRRFGGIFVRKNESPSWSWS
eukprot:COSAG04_NODE_15358_length_534_cov_1.059770_1_plen_64_part_10